MTLRNVIKLLRRSGIKVSYRARKDGSIRVTSINGRRFSAQYSEGNKQARLMAGVTLSERRARQLEGERERIAKRIAKGKPRKPRVPKLNPEVQRALRKAQRLIRKAGAAEGTVTARNVRYNIKVYGEEEALRRLNRTSRYYQGYAYEENVKAFTDRMREDGNKLLSEELVTLSGYIWENRQKVTERQLQAGLEKIYDMEDYCAKHLDDRAAIDRKTYETYVILKATFRW